MRALILLHRWLGVPLSLLVLLWFLSGIVLLYRSFPEITAADRLARIPALSSVGVQVPVEAAFAALGWDEAPTGVRMTTFDGRPVYRFERDRRSPAMVYADDGTRQSLIDAAMIDRAAARWAGRNSADATRTEMAEPDQWTVGGRLRTLRPLWKYAWPDGQEVYVDGRTAEVVQYTTTRSRIWAHLGAIPHWLYYTQLRQHAGPWFSTIVWTSALATVSALLGLAIAVGVVSPRRRYRHEGRPTAIPYRRWKRWHAIAGLMFGVVTVTWAFSGLLSMGPFPLADRIAVMTTGDNASSVSGTRAIELAMGGDATVRLASFASRPVRDALGLLTAEGFEARELTFRTFGGQPFYLAMDASGDTRVVNMTGASSRGLDEDVVVRTVRGAAASMPVTIERRDRYDAYYFDRRGQRPLPVIFVEVGAMAPSRVYLDPRTGTVAGTYHATDWIDRWLYRGLHSMAFPGLYTRRPLWDVVVIGLLLGGTVLAATSVVLAWRVVVRTITSLVLQFGK